MAKAPSPPISTPGDQVGQPNAERNRASEIVLVEIAKLQSDGEHIKRDVNELRPDMKDLRDRMKGLEVRVEHLPSKDFIVKVVLTTIGIATAILTLLTAIAPLIQRLVGTAPR